MAVIEVDDAEAILEGTAPWQPFFNFKVIPVMEVTEAVPIFAKVIEWRDSVD